jgi:hypothetical protein
MARRVAAALIVVGAVGAGAALRFREQPPPLSTLVRGTQALSPGRRLALPDPVAPGRLVFTLESPTAAQRAGDAWVSARPDPAFLPERAPEERGGIDPCALPPAEKEAFSPWQQVAGRSYVAFPRSASIRRDGGFDTVLLFHGHDVAHTVLAEVDVPIVLFGTSLGDYRSEYAGPEALGQLISAVEAKVSEAEKRPAHADHVALASWSGGYDAISVLLEQSKARDRVDAVALLDGLHGSRDPKVMPQQLGPFVRFAQRAAKGEVFMFVSHSSIDTDGFASTTETMHFLAHEVGGKPLRVSRSDPLGLQLIETFDRGEFHLRGYAGGGKRDHCANLGLYPVVLRALARRWKRA